MAVKKRNKRVYTRAVPMLLVGLMLLTVSAAMYVASARSHSAVDVVHGMFTPLSSSDGRDNTAGIRARKQKADRLKAFPSAGQSVGPAISRRP